MWLTISQPTERPTQRSVPFSLVAAHRQNALIARCRVPTPFHFEHFFAFTHYFESTFSRTSQLNFLFLCVQKVS